MTKRLSGNRHYEESFPTSACLTRIFKDMVPYVVAFAESMALTGLSLFVAFLA